MKSLQSDDYNVYMYLDDELVGTEHLCCMAHASEQSWICRNSLKTQEIIIQLRSKMCVLLDDDHPPRGELIDKAIRYMDSFWSQLFAYQHDGSYSIDNSIVERFIRPLAGERKNSLFFGSDKMARVSAVYHTIISTC